MLSKETKDQKAEPTPVQWMDKAINALYLELPSSIADDVKKRWQEAKEYLQSESAVWKEKAEGLAEALKKIIKGANMFSSITIATKALEQFK